MWLLVQYIYYYMEVLAGGFLAPLTLYTLSEHKRSYVLLDQCGLINFAGWLWIAFALWGVYCPWDYFPWG